MDRIIAEVDIERRRATPTEPTIPGPTLIDAQRAYSADYEYPLTHAAVDPSTLTDLNTRWVDGITPGDDANPGTQAAPVRTIAQGLVLAKLGGYAHVAIKGTFRTRNIINQQDVKVVGWPGVIPIWECPDTYGSAAAFNPPGGAVAFIPSFGHYHILATSYHYVGGSLDINSVHSVDLIAQNWTQTATSTWTSRSGAALTPVLVKRTVFHPINGGTPLAFTATSASASGFRSTYFQLTGLDAIPDSNVTGSPTNHATVYAQWEITTVDVAFCPNATIQLVAFNYCDRTAGGSDKAFALYGAMPGTTKWEVLYEQDNVVLGNYLSPANVNVSVNSSLFDWHTIKGVNKRYYLLQPLAPAAGTLVKIIDPLMAWDEFGNLLTFDPPQLHGMAAGVDCIRTRTCDIEFYKGTYYLTCDTGIYASEDGLTGWVPVFTDGNIVPRFMHICNGVLFVSAERSITSMLPANETRMVYTFDGLTWNYLTMPWTATERFAGEVFSLGGCIVGIANTVSSTTPYRYFQEPLIWNKHTSVTNFQLSLENIDIQLRDKCGSLEGDWFSSST